MPSFFSTTIIPTNVIQSMMANKPNIKKCSQVSITVRSLGTATYIGFGGIDSQDRRLNLPGMGFAISAEYKPDGKDYFFDPNLIYCISDTSDAVIEIFGESLT